MLTKFFYSTMKGAPILPSEWGGLLNVLKACLINGFNSQQVSSVAIADGVATIALGSNHGFIEHQVVAISGANEVGFNADYRVLSVADTAITVSTSLLSATGTMTIKTAPLGWTEQFTGVNKSVFKAKDTLKNRFVLRVDDSKPTGYEVDWAKFARITIAESMSDIDTFIGAKAPTSVSNADTNEQGNSVSGQNGIFGWAKWYHGVETTPALREWTSTGQLPAFEWEIVGDDSSLYFFTQITNSDGRATYAFTPIITNNSTDMFNCFLSAANGLRSATALGDPIATGGNSANCHWDSLNTSGKFILRPYTGVGATHAECGLFSLNMGNNQQISGYSSDMPFPNLPDNSVLLHDIYVKEAGGVRGTLPVIKWINHKWSLTNKIILKKQQGLFLVLGASYNNNGMVSYYAFELE